MNDRKWFAGNILKGLFVLGFAVLLGVSPAFADAITGTQAKTAAARWAARNPRPLDTPIGSSAKAVKTHRDANGKDAYHLVALEGGGTIVMPADDGVLPVIAIIAGDGSPDEDPRNPLWTLLSRDVSNRVAAAEAESKRLSSSSGTAAADDQDPATSPAAAKAAWAELLADDATVLKGALYSIDDVRVAPLLSTKWDQGKVDGYCVYNYYVPNNYPCGCVATAGAQVMRYFKYPTGSVQARSFSCAVNRIPVTRTMRGGTYSWASMPSVPASTSLTLEQRKAIGKLCYDIGVAVGMDWTVRVSSSMVWKLRDAFTSVFGYSHADAYTYTSGIAPSSLRRMMYSNLDAGYPVILGILGGTGSERIGHAIVGDGYGFSGSTAYTHLNMGWSGTDSIWYNLPTVECPNKHYVFSVVDELLYNIYKSGSGDLLTGRLVDSSGSALSGVTVKAYYNGSLVATTTSKANGLYAFRLTGGRTYTITANYGNISGRRTVTLDASVSSSGYNEYGGSSGGVAGNSWGNNLTLIYSAPVSGPSNDNFGNARVISGTSGNVTGSNNGATLQSGESAVIPNSATKSVWWKWTPTRSGPVTFTTRGTDFDTIMGVYTGSSLGSLSEVAANDDAVEPARYSACSFTATAYRTYYIAVAGYKDASGAISLSWTQSSAPITYTVKYDGNGGYPSYQTRTQPYRQRMVLGTTPRRTGFTFGGWINSYNQTVTASTVYTRTSDSTCRARWYRNKYTVTYLGNGGEPDKTYYQQPYYQNMVVPDAPDRSDDYIFLGWTNSVGETVTSSTLYTKSSGSTCGAKWARKGDFPWWLFSTGAASASKALYSSSSFGSYGSVAVPTGLRATVGTWMGQRVLNLSWNKVNGATAYSVYVGTSKSRLTSNVGMSFDGGDMTGAGINPLNFVSVKKSTTLYVTVCAVKGQLSSGPCTPVSVYWTVADAVPTPQAHATDGSYSSYVNITWSKASGNGLKGYYIYRRVTTSSAKATRIATLKTTATSYKDSTAKKGVKYYYWVIPYTSSGMMTNWSRRDLGYIKDGSTGGGTIVVKPDAAMARYWMVKYIEQLRHVTIAEENYQGALRNGVGVASAMASLQSARQLLAQYANNVRMYGGTL